MEWFPDNWADVLLPEQPLFELVVRGAALYLGILLLMRIVPRRTAGEVSVMDLLFVMLVSEGASNSLGGYETVGDGFIVIITFLACSYFVDYLSFKFKPVQRLFEHSSIQIIRDGKIIARNMRREFLSMDELMSQLRALEIEHISEVKKAYIESDGTISAIPYKKN